MPLLQDRGGQSSRYVEFDDEDSQGIITANKYFRWVYADRLYNHEIP